MTMNFSPLGDATVSIAATTTTANVALNLPTAPMSVDVRLYNSGFVPIHVRFGNASVTATTTNMPIAPQTVEAFSISGAATHMAAITSSGTGTIFATVGMGV
jgi:hypothetical protein